MLTKEFCDSSFEPSPPLVLSGVSLIYNEFIDDVELAVDGDEIHSPSVAQKRRRLPHKRKVSNVKKSIVKRSGKAISRVTLISIKENKKKKKKDYLLSFPWSLIIIIKKIVCISQHFHV